MIERGPDPNQIKEHINNLGIECVGFDGDDTLWRTSEAYGIAIRDIAIIMAGNEQELKEIKVVEELLKNAIRKSKTFLQVNPSIMFNSILDLAEQLNIDYIDLRVRQSVLRARRIFAADKFELYEGADRVLQIFGEPVVFTHAEQAWTERKIAESGIGGYLADIVCMDVDRPKREQWEEILSKRDIDPNNFLMVGDNFYEDILPVLKLGGRTVFLDNNGKITEIFKKLNSEDKAFVANVINNKKFGSAHNICNVSDVFMWMV